jgi:hypothetical protein
MPPDCASGRTKQSVSTVRAPWRLIPAKPRRRPEPSAATTIRPEARTCRNQRFWPGGGGPAIPAISVSYQIE